MKNLNNCLAQGFAIKTVQGWVKTISVAALGAAFFIMPMTSKADSGPIMTQADLLRCLVTLNGGSLLDATADSLIAYATDMGIKPREGWNLNATLTKQFLAEVIADWFQLNGTGNGNNAIRALEREGIVLPDEFAQENVIPVFDDFEFASRRQQVSTDDCTPKTNKKGKPQKFCKGNNGKGNGQDPPPPGWQNPKNPHFGTPQNDE